MKTLALYNVKGGVGKTAAAVNLAWIAADSGLRVLLWDLDPQGAATFYFRAIPRQDGHTRKLVKGKENLRDLTHGTDCAGLDIIPADFANRNLDVVLDTVKKSTKRLARLLESLDGAYDVALLDCPPSFSVLSENVFHAADLILMPLIPTTLSMNSLAQVCTYFAAEHLPTARLLAFFSMVDARKRLHRDTMADPPGGVGFCRAAIPYRSEVERMGVLRAPLPAFSPKSAAAQAYRALWSEVVDRDCD